MLLKMIRFWGQVLVLSLLTWPIATFGQEVAAEVPLSLFGEPLYELREVSSEAPLLPPTPEEPYQYPIDDAPAVYAESQSGVVGNACAPNYWIVSSRCSAQSHRQACNGSCPLDVFQRTPDRRFHRSSLDAMGCQLDPRVPVCIFAHGSYVTWESQLIDAEATYQRVSRACGCPIQMIFYTWPSDERVTPLIPADVRIHGLRAEFNGFYVAQLISRIPESCPVCLIGHSHGVRVCLAAMHLAGGGTLGGCRPPCDMGCRRYRLIMAAGAVNHNWLNPGQQYGCALNRVECALLFVNQKDIALIFYPLTGFRAHTAISKRGFSRQDVALIGPQAGKVRELNVSQLLGMKHNWHFYYRQPQIIGAMVPYIYFQ
ncbi:MAG: hypothetical protein KDA80_22815 [Planctomycetaceae bacterium]|nr:hypothetical protein [Planctomycetaceae bacterium]